MDKRGTRHLAGILLLCCAGTFLSGCATRRVWQSDNYSVQPTTNFTVVGYATTNDDLILVMTNGQTFSMSLLPDDIRHNPRYLQDWMNSKEVHKQEFRHQRLRDSLKDLHVGRGRMEWCDMSALQTGKTYTRTVQLDLIDSQDYVFVKPDADYAIWYDHSRMLDTKLVSCAETNAVTAIAPIDMPGVRLVPKRYNLWSIPVRVILTPFAVVVDAVGTPVCIGGYLIWMASDPNARRS